MDEEDYDERLKLGWLGLVDEHFHYSPVVAVEDRFWKLKPHIRLEVLNGWKEAVEVLIEGNDEFGNEDNEKPEELSSAVIIKFPDV